MVGCCGSVASRGPIEFFIGRLQRRGWKPFLLLIEHVVLHSCLAGASCRKVEVEEGAVVGSGESVSRRRSEGANET